MYSVNYNVKTPDYNLGDCLMLGALGTLTGGSGLGGFGMGSLGMGGFGLGGFGCGSFGSSIYSAASRYSGYNCYAGYSAYYGSSKNQIGQTLGMMVGTIGAAYGIKALDKLFSKDSDTPAKTTTTTTSSGSLAATPTGTTQLKTKATTIVDKEQPGLKAYVKRAEDNLEAFDDASKIIAENEIVIENLQTRNSNSQVRLTELVNDNEGLIKQKQEEITKAQEQNPQNTGLIARLKNEKAILEQEKKSLENAINNNNTSIDDAQKKIGEAKATTISLGGNRTTLENAKTAAEKAYNDAIEKQMEELKNNSQEMGV